MIEENPIPSDQLTMFGGQALQVWAVRATLRRMREFTTGEVEVLADNEIWHGEITRFDTHFEVEDLRKRGSIPKLEKLLTEKNRPRDLDELLAREVHQWEHQRSFTKRVRLWSVATGPHKRINIERWIDFDFQIIWEL